jgi:hypothetical protein
MKKVMGVVMLLWLLTALPALGKGSHSHNSPKSTTACCSKSRSDVHVHGYTKKNGTVVKPYTRSHENATQRDDFSTKGNVNPYTGKVGTKQAKH